MKSSSFRVTAAVLVNHKPLPFSDWSIDINAYSLASAIDATISRATAKGFSPLPDFGQLAQTIKAVGGVRAVPFEIHCGYDLMPSNRKASANLILESGFIDEMDTIYDERIVTFAGRGQASIFQDIQINKPVNRSQGGDKIVKQFFAQYAPKLELHAVESPGYAGKTTGDPVYNLTMRDRTVWDEMQACALEDGFRLSVHANKAVYGPPGDKDPILDYAWGKAHHGGGGITQLRIRHAPRRSHNIKVIVRSYLRRGKQSVYATYGNASATEGETFNFFVSGKNRAQTRQLAQTIWYDVASREFLATVTIIPDETFMQTIASHGANFLINLSGDVIPSHRLTYGVRQVRLEGSNARQSLPLRAQVTMGNVNPIQSGAYVSS